MNRTYLTEEELMVVLKGLDLIENLSWNRFKDSMENMNNEIMSSKQAEHDMNEEYLAAIHKCMDLRTLILKPELL